jgi:hypothetical protein
MTRSIILAFLIAGCLAACGSGSSLDTYCSGSQGPVSASEASKLTDAILCPRPGDSNGTCVQGGGPRLQCDPSRADGGAADCGAAPAWGCVTENGESGVAK